MLNVLGLGYPRTGTMSLKLALQQLGFGPCYHMIDVFDRPADVSFWRNAVQRDGVDVDWDTLFHGFESTSDCPACYFWKPLTDHFPHAGCILTVRDPESWYDSFRTTVYEAMMHPERAADEQHRAVQQMARELILDRMFSGRFLDRSFAIDCMHAHNEAIIDAIPADRLLVYQISDGWEPLCRFLNVEVPDVAFPQVNTRDQFRQRFAVDS
ncbi:MAG: sulfotransferase [Planctomycetaceae bacterium]